MKKLLMLIFFVRVLVPGNNLTFKNVESWRSFSNDILELTLTDGKKVIVPTMWTVIEEK